MIDFMLFNLVGTTVAQDQLRKAYNHALQTTGYELTAVELEELQQQRQQIFQDYQLVDFSYQSMLQLAENLCSDFIFSKAILLETLAVLQEIYYYLQTVNETSLADEEIIARIIRHYEAYAGDLDGLQGYFEAFPNNLTGGFADDRE